jgi:Lrp/AsnC family transcriptional regulator, regulator for asnA, asnC and gidA
MSESDFTDLDQLDIQLLGELQSDARQTYTDLAAKLRVTRPVVTKRVRRLLDSRVVDIFCLADPKALGFEIIAILAINVQSGHMNDVVHRLIDCSSIRHMHLCTGSFNIFAHALLRNNEDLEQLLLNELDSIPGIQHIETMLTLELVKVLPTMLLADGNQPRIQENREKELTKLDDLDVKLIRELQIKPRQKTTYIARKLGVHETTITRRIQRLVYEDVVQFKIINHPFAIGYRGIAMIGLTCDQSKISEIANTVASYKQVQTVAICAGRYDMTASVAFRQLIDLRNFISIELGGIPGLIRTDTMITYKIAKAMYRIPY